MSGPLSHPQPPIQRRTFNECSTGTILQQSGLHQGDRLHDRQRHGRQNVLVRADLLVGTNSLEATSFQLEFLPSGTVCRGKVQTVRSFGFDAVCTLADGTRRHVHAAWRLVDHANLRGRLSAVPVGAASLTTQ